MHAEPIPGMAAALWNVGGKAANLAQLSGLHVVMLIGVGMTLLRIPQCRRACAELQLCVRDLRARLRWPLGYDFETVIERTGLGPMIRMALHDADRLVNSYNNSTLWFRVRRSRSMASQFRDMQNDINSYCQLVLLINGSLLIHSIHPPCAAATILQVDDRSQRSQAVTHCPAGAQAFSTPADTQRVSNIGTPGTQRVNGGMGSQPSNHEPGCEMVTAIVISQAGHINPA